MPNKDFQNGYAAGLASKGQIIKTVEAEPIKSAIYNDDDTLDIVDKDDVEHEVVPTYTNNRITSITYDGTSMAVTYDGDGNLTKVGNCDIDGTEEYIGTGIVPSGSLSITENGTYDVTEKASAVVNVQGGASGLPLEIASNCPSPFLLNQNNITSNVKYIFPTTTASVVLTDDTVITEVDVGDEVKTKLSPTNDYATFNYQWQNCIQSEITSGTDNFNNYSRNRSAQAAYTSIDFDSTTKVNTIVNYGSTIGWERIGYRITLLAGQSISYKMKYKSEVAVTSSGYTPHAPFIFIGASNVLDTESHLYGSSSIYVSTVLPVTAMSDYQEFFCSYENTTGSSIEVIIGLDTGSTADSVSRTFYVKDMGIGGFAFNDISGATSSTYTAQTGDNAIRCILTGTGNSEGTITSSRIEVQEVD